MATSFLFSNIFFLFFALLAFFYTLTPEKKRCALAASQLSCHCGHPLCVRPVTRLCCCLIVVIGQLKSCDKLTAQNLLPAHRLKLLMKKYWVRSYRRSLPETYPLLLRLCSEGMRQHFVIAIRRGNQGRSHHRIGVCGVADSGYLCLPVAIKLNAVHRAGRI